jgi:ribosomal protein L11 methyltransferase
MDPGMAFGTGHHATTKLCLQMMKDCTESFENREVLDVGTGTGILAMAAVLWGASKALAIDNDPEAVRVANENILRNRLSDRITASGAGLEKVTERFPLVVANIIHDTLLSLAGSLCNALEQKGILILSGLVHGTQTDSIIRCFEEKNLQLAGTLEEGEWGALKFIKNL